MSLSRIETRFKNAPARPDPLLAAIARYMLSVDALHADIYVNKLTRAAGAGAHALLSTQDLVTAFDDDALSDVVALAFIACETSPARLRRFRRLQADGHIAFLLTDLTTQAALRCA